MSWIGICTVVLSVGVFSVGAYLHNKEISTLNSQISVMESVNRDCVEALKQEQKAILAMLDAVKARDAEMHELRDRFESAVKGLHDVLESSAEAKAWGDVRIPDPVLRVFQYTDGREAGSGEDVPSGGVRGADTGAGDERVHQ